MSNWQLLPVTLAIFALAAGCERKAPEIHGIGDYILGKTTLGQSGGVCSPSKSQTWCTSMEALKVGEQSASVDLYFDGHKDAAPLVEILLAIRACKPKSALSALSHELGKPTTVKGNRARWDGKRAVIIARLPLDKSPTECEVSFVHPAKGRTIEYLWTGVMPPKEGAPPAPKK